MNLDKVKDSLEKYLNEKKIKLFEINYQKSEETLSILLDEKLDMNEIESISNEISEYLDSFDDEFENNYILDVSTVGAERPIRNEEELISAIGEYVYCKLKDSEYYGTLKKYESGELILEIKDKTRIRDVNFKYSDVKNVRYAVKF